MPRRALLVSFVTILCTALLVFGVHASYDKEGNDGHAVTVSVQATDNSGGVLGYQWRSTDGKITDVNAATTTWVLPPGPGLHFAYVLVSNGRGGYTERRLAINTDTFAREDEDTDTFAGENENEREKERRPLAAPPAPAQQGDYFRSFVSVGETLRADGTQHYVYAPDLLVDGFVTSDLKGEYVFGGVTPGFYGADTCVLGSNSFLCGSAAQYSEAGFMLGAATTDYVEAVSFLSVGPISGSLTLADSATPCGTINEFFGVRSTATATLLDASGNQLATVRVNEFGDYSLPYSPNAASVSLQCENAPPVVVAISGLSSIGGTDVGPARVASVYAPGVAGMSATLNGTPLSANTSPAAFFLPPHTQFPGDTPPTDFPSNIVARSDGFLAEKGLDTRLGACQYYKAVGAVRSCDAAGNLIGAIRFSDWQRAVKIGKYARRGVPTYKASYINAVDLNLARVHQSISYGPNQTAAVVCNHLGIPITTSADFLSPAQSEIDTAVGNAVRNTNLVACVAMDYTISPGVNNGKPFIRFLIFGPSGQLLPSVNLDERREKFVPGTCVVCHGGDHYAGKYPEDGSGFADVGGHFLPYDVGNFEFSSAPGLTKCDQEEAIYHLNQNVLNAGPTAAEAQLIAGWYAKGPTNCAANSTNLVHVLDQDYVPTTWQQQGPAAIAFYKGVNARSCRTCHVAMLDTSSSDGSIASYNFEIFANVAPGTHNNRFADVDADFSINLCGGSPQFERDHMMPNSLNTFNRFWLSSVAQANTTGLPNQPALFTALYTNGFCGPSPGLTP